MTTTASGRTTPEPHTRSAAGTQADRDAVARTAVGSVLWLALTLVSWWWAAGGGLTDLADPRTALVSLGRETGLVASVLLLAQVLLMSRIPVLEGAFGQDRLAAVHRQVGFTSFTLMLTHVVLITWGYAAGDLLATPSTLWDLTLTYPGMLLAVAGTGFLCLVVLTSIRAARRRLRYESWHLLHLYAYLGVGLALPHQLWTGQELLGSTARTVFWWGAWGAAVAAVLLWRIGLPAYRTLRHDLRVTSVVREQSGPGRLVVSVYLSGRDLDRLPVQAGQFLWFRFLGGPGRTRAHPFSLSAAPDGRSLRITADVVGDGTRALLALRPGVRVVVEGPHGRLTGRARTRRKVALVGAGVGITPLRALAEGLDYAPGEALLVQRCRSVPLFDRELDVLGVERGLQVVTLAGPRRDPESWLPTGLAVGHDDVTALLAWIPDLPDRDLYLCGPDPWVARVRDCALAAGLPPRQLHVESFSW
jgi:predicted ferric reductase